MKKIDINYLNECLLYDHKNGIISWKKRPNNHFSANNVHAAFNAKFAGCAVGRADRKGYLIFEIDGSVMFCHRVAFAMFHRRFPSGEIDHINGVKNDNRIENLRDVPGRENSKNKSVYKNNVSGVPGVGIFKRLNKWKVRINVNGDDIHLGYFTSFIEACEARIVAEVKYGFHKNHGRVNNCQR